MNLKNFMLLYILLTLTFSCSSQKTVLQKPKKERFEMCTLLSAFMICTDPRIDKAPLGCFMLEKYEHTYKCPIPNFLGYQCTSPENYKFIREKIDELTLQNEIMARELN